MTVKELRKALKGFDRDALVVINNAEALRFDTVCVAGGINVMRSTTPDQGMVGAMGPAKRSHRHAVLLGTEKL